jgi:GTP-binding protein
MEKVAIIGRPNVGKSTLFNRLAGKPVAIVDKIPNVTRDHLEYKITWEGDVFLLIDTAGFQHGKNILRDKLNILLDKTISKADLIIFLTDARSGIHPLDEIIYKKIKTSGKKFLLVANKIDTQKMEESLVDFYKFGCSHIVGISAQHGRNIDVLLDTIVENLSSDSNKTENLEGLLNKEVINIVVAGRPNVGKSSLINKIIDEERLLVTEIPGTTRDPVKLAFNYSNQSYLITDTAGIRKKSVAFKDNIEKVSYHKSVDATLSADVVILMLDATAGLTSREIKIAGNFFDRGKAIVIVINKWDKIKDKKLRAKTILDSIRDNLLFLDNPYVIFVSALTGENINSVLKTVNSVYKQYALEVKTSYLNKVLELASKTHSTPTVGNRKAKFYYMTQIGIKPPKFLIFTNYARAVDSSYKKYLINSLRKAGSFRGVPIELHLKSRKETDFF